MSKFINFKKKREEVQILEGMPRSETGEKAILSCLLSNPEDLIPHASENIPPEAFYNPVNQMIFREIMAMHSGGKVIDITTLSQHLIDKRLMENIGGPVFLAELLHNIPTPAFYPHYKILLDDKLRIRKAMQAASNIVDTLKSESVSDFSEMSEEVLVSLCEIREAMESKTKETTMEEEIDSWEQDWSLMASGKKESAMSLRWPCWNTEVGGLAPGYHIISGTSSSGKSTLLGNIMMDSCIRNKRPGLYVSYEMSVKMIVSRLVADLADVDGMHLFQPDRSYPTSEIKKAISGALSIIRKSPLRIVHQPRLSAEGACHIARKMFVDMGDLVFGIDYVQLIAKPADIEKNANREREVSTNSATFRTFSKEIDRPVIVLSQLNQDGQTRESGSINMDGDSHMKVDREKDNKTGKVSERGVWVYKSRNGASSFHLPLFLNGARFRFEERQKK